MANYYPRRIQPADQLVYDASGNLVGVRSGTSGDETIYGLNSTEYQAFQSLVSGDRITPHPRYWFHVNVLRRFCCS